MHNIPLHLLSASTVTVFSLANASAGTEGDRVVVAVVDEEEEVDSDVVDEVEDVEDVDDADSAGCAVALTASACLSKTF